VARGERADRTVQTKTRCEAAAVTVFTLFVKWDAPPGEKVPGSDLNFLRKEKCYVWELPCLVIALMCENEAV
jgi:hypothetical protein